MPAAVPADAAATVEARAVLPRYAATETILPFVLQERQVPNPAWAAWHAALSNPCGTDPAHCLDQRLKVYFYVPANAKAVVYIFHGGQSSAHMWITGEEEAALIGDLVRNDYAVVLLESTHRSVDSNWFFPDPQRFDPAGFNPPPPPPAAGNAYIDAWNATVNADELLVRDVHTALDPIVASKVFLVGFSSGGKFASAMAYSLKLAPPAMDDYFYTTPRTNTAGGLDVRAAAVYGNIGVPFYFGNYVAPAGPPASVPLAYAYSTPTIFSHGVNDPNNPPAEVAANAAFLAGLGVPVEDNAACHVQLRPDRFARVLGISLAESRAIYDALVSQYVDANGFVLPAADSAPVLALLPADKRQGVEEQLKVLRAEHHVSSENHHRTVAFFDAHL
jgi:pimeloyl-ACP methyl ester carboxylesterase